jgi:hypothetical protein
MPGPVPGIHVLLLAECSFVDGRDKPGHDVFGSFAPRRARDDIFMDCRGFLKPTFTLSAFTPAVPYPFE